MPSIATPISLSRNNPNGMRHRYYTESNRILHRDPQLYTHQKWHSLQTYTEAGSVGARKWLGTLIFVLQRTPGVNFFYFIIDMTPAYEDIVGFLNSISVISALLFAASSAIPLSVGSDELQIANQRWSLDGEYGCYDFAGCHNYKTLSLRFGNMCAAAVYTTVTTLVLSSIVLVSAQSLSAVAQFEHDTRVPSSKVRSGPLKGSQAKPIRSFQLSNSSVPPHRLQAWWTWAKWPAVLCVLPLLAAVPCTMQAFRSVFMIKFRSPQMSQRCAELGWVYNHTTSEGLRIYNHTEAKWDGCYKPMDRSLGADDDPIGVLEEYSQMFIWTAAFTFFTVGFGALWGAIAEPTFFEESDAETSAANALTDDNHMAIAPADVTNPLVHISASPSTTAQDDNGQPLPPSMETDVMHHASVVSLDGHANAMAPPPPSSHATNATDATAVHI
eukprot:m.387398 g.387398  ORF g.387398 m.387398 type:complete len:442 (-) comp21029_c0_seq7:52-1377(-)